jgi:hypothetical protein
MMTRTNMMTGIDKRTRLLTAQSSRRIFIMLSTPTMLYLSVQFFDFEADESLFTDVGAPLMSRGLMTSPSV